MAARTLGLPNLRDGIAASGSSAGPFPGIVEQVAPISPDDSDFIGGLVYYDLGMYDLADPELLAFAPPISNDYLTSNCDPHARGFDTFAKVRQMSGFLGATGVIEDHCDGFCDGFAADGGFAPDELSEGRVVPCDPRTEPPFMIPAAP
jgi:hypothetical protein